MRKIVNYIISTIFVLFLFSCSTLSIVQNNFYLNIYYGNIQEVKTALKNKTVNVNQIYSGKLTPLTTAIIRKENEIAILLIKNGADVNLTAGGMEAPIHYAAIYGNKRVLELLVEKGADINARSTTEILPYKYAVIYQNNEAINFFKENNALFAIDLDIPISSKNYILSAEAQEYLSINQKSDYPAERYLCIFQEPHYFDSQWNLFRGLEIFFADNPGLIKKTIFLSEGIAAGQKISLAPLLDIDPTPSDEIIRAVLNSYLIPAYYCLEWKHQYGIPIVGMEDKRLYDISGKLWVNMNNDAFKWNLSVVSRNKAMAENLIEYSKNRESPIMFVGGLHLTALDDSVYKKAQNNSFPEINSEDRDYLKKFKNWGLADYLKQEKIGYIFINAINAKTNDEIKKDEQKYKKLFQAQISDNIDEYIKWYYNSLKKTEGVTVQPDVENAAKLVRLLKNDNKGAGRDRDIDDVDNPEEWPENPDDWLPPEGVKEEDKARESSGGKHRQWKDGQGKIVRRWDAGGREGGKDRGPHWHDGDDNHVKPGGGIDN